MTTNQNTLKSEIETRLEKLAYKRTIPFCYGCYQRAPSGRCELCFSDDLMRELAGDGVEYGVDWVIRSLLSSDLTPVDAEEAFEQSIADCYSETTKIGWLEYDTITAIKELDPVSWRCALSEWQCNEEDSGQIFSADGGSTYYWTHDVERYLDENESDEDCA
jgi:hypothetical protein